MKMSKTAVAAMVAGLVAFAPNVKAESEDLGTMPYLHPHPCKVKLNTSGYDVFWSRNCEVAYIAPNAVAKAQHHIKLLGGARLCPSFNSNTDSMTALTAMSNALLAKSAAEFAKGNDKKSKEYADTAIQYANQGNQILELLKASALMPASTVQSEFFNDVTGTDLRNFRIQNMDVLDTLREQKLLHPEIVVPEFQILPVMNSTYSFNLVRHADGNANLLPDILATTLPGLELLIQPDSKTNTVHVKASNGVSGSTTLSLNGTCAWAQPSLLPVGAPVAAGLELPKIESGPSFVTVNRSYDVQMKAGYSMSAKLDKNITNSVVQTLAQDSLDHNLTKTQIYNKTLSLNGFDSSVTEVDADMPLTDEERASLIDGVQKGLMDRYLALYEQKGLLADLRLVPVALPNGGNVDETYWRTVCWSSSSWFGLSSDSGCYDQSYKVPVWHDGHAYSEFVEKDLINIEFTEKHTVYDVVTLPRSTIFTNEIAKEVSNEKK